MTSNKIEYVKESIFEQYKKLNEFGQEYWSAREFYKIIDYKRWDSFIKVIDRAKNACQNSNQDIENHFRRVTKMVTIGSNAPRDVGDLQLSRYACYLIVQNADPSKPIVALGQTYFAIQTRKQEIQESNAYIQLGTEDEKRLFLREEMKKHNKKLMSTAKNAGLRLI